MTLAAAVSQDAMTVYFEGLGRLLGRVERRASFAMYAAGLLSDLERTSVEPIAALASDGSTERCAAYHHRLLHLLNTSPWSDEDVRAYAAEYALRALTEDEPVEAWSLDDTGFLKQGDDAVGVQRHSTGSAGKITHGQVAASLTVATRTAHLPVDMDLYLPESWASDPGRRKAAKIPDEVVFRTKHDIALDLLARAVLADAAARLRTRRQRLRLVGSLPRRGHPARPAVRLRRALVARRATRRCPRPATPADVGQGGGRRPAPEALARGDVARRDEGALALALRARGGRGRERRPERAGAPALAGRVARGREGAVARHLGDIARRERAARARSNHESAVAGRADLRRPQGGAGPRPRRRSELGRLAAPCQRGARLLRARALLVNDELSPPRPPGRVPLVRSRARPERHVADSFLTVRLAITRLVRAWLAPLVRRELARRARGRQRLAGSEAGTANLLQ
jgi:hypothetical protein